MKSGSAGRADYAQKIFFFRWEHGPQIEQQFAVLDSRHHWRIAHAAALFRLYDVIALHGDQPALERPLRSGSAADQRASLNNGGPDAIEPTCHALGAGTQFSA